MIRLIVSEDKYFFALEKKWKISVEIKFGQL